jgi:hypothetical protein
MGQFTRNKRVVSNLAGAWCNDCHWYEGWTSKHDFVRMRTKRHVERTGHTVDMTVTIVRRYKKEE